MWMVVDAAVRQADVIDDVSHLAGGISLADGCLHQVAEPRRLLNSQCRSFARRCRMNCPLSVSGKKSCPSQGSRNQQRQAAQRKTGTNTYRRCTSFVSSGGRHSLHAFELRSKARWKRTNGLRVCAVRCDFFACSRYIAMVGTSVRDSTYDASIANTTASASGTNRYRATPARKNIGTNTMQMHSVETSAGTAICARLRESRCAVSCPSSRLRSMFSIVDRRVVHQDADRQRQTAQRHDVDGFAQARPAQMTEVRIDSGIEIAMISVLRQLPRKSRIIAAGQAGRDDRFAHDSVDRCPHEDRLIGERLIFSSGGRVWATRGRILANPCDHVDRGSVAGLEDGHQHAAPPVRSARCWSAARSRRRPCATSRR